MLFCLARRARIFYNGGISTTPTVCDICEEENCGDVCAKSNPLVSESSGGKSGSSLPRLHWLLPFAVAAKLLSAAKL